MTTADPLEHFKTQFHRSADAIHLNNSGQAPMCRPARTASERCLEHFYRDGALSYPSVSATLETARGDVAALLGCKPIEIAFLQSAAAAISQVAFGLDLKADDEIIAWDQEYPSSFYPWLKACQRSGAKLVIAKSDPSLATPLSTIEKLITKRTRVIAVSWVQYINGAITDLAGLAKLARASGIFTCVDVIQGAGCLPFNFHALGIDAACGGSHKWLSAGHGAGFMCLREEHLEKLEPIMHGALTYGTPDTPIDFDMRPKKDSHRFEPGSLAFAEIHALGAAARLYRETGIDRIAQEAEWLAKRLLHGLRQQGHVIQTPHGAHHRGAIVNFAPGPDCRYQTLAAVQARLDAHRIANAIRGRGLRLSPHAFNTPEEVDRVLEVLSS